MPCTYLLFLVLLIAGAWVLARIRAARERRRLAKRREFVAWCADVVRCAREANEDDKPTTRSPS